MDHADVAIVGAGHSGAQCAIALRQNGFTGTITVIGREPEYPYERPALSKEYFAGEKSFERLYIKSPAFWMQKNIEFRLETEVSALDPQERTLTFSDGATFGYGTLVWAAGGDPRKLVCPGSDLEGVHAVRTRADCDALMGAIAAGTRNVVVIGGGYVGLEAAAVLTKMGVKVTLLALTRVLARAGEELSFYYQRKHRDNGVDLRTGVEVERIEGEEGKVTSVVLSDDERIEADAVIVGIGIVPAVAPLIAAGAKGENGVEVDEHCRTSLPHVYAIGDCAAFACHYAGGRTMRVESVQNANDMATCVAKFICGEAKPYNALPWFWSNQYDLLLQTAGINTGFDRTVVRGDPDAGAFSVVYLKNGRVLALDCVNAVKDYVQGRKLVEAGAVPDMARLADARVPLKDLLPQD